MDHQKIQSSIFRISSTEEFNDTALKIFRYQSKKNAIYREYIELLGINPKSINDFHKIPFLPIQFFKDQQIITGDDSAYDVKFTSSGTTSSIPSIHYVKDLQLYRKSFYEGFKSFYGPPENYCILALLPSYLERSNSSLIYMVNELINSTQENGSGFYLDEYSELLETHHQRKNKNKVLILGVSFALLDLAEKFPADLSGCIIMETGGMKGRRKELTRKELHDKLCRSFNVNQIHSEYGMTELLSQAYSTEDGLFCTSAWMKVLVRDPNDPLSLLDYEKTGGINIIDLANINSCSFIATQDLGKLYENKSFEILGRFDESDIRGCNLMLV